MTDPPVPPPPSETIVRRQAFLIAWAAGAAYVLLQDTSNALSAMRDRPALDPREPFVWEWSSGVMVIALVPLIAWLLRMTPPEPRRWLRFALTHLAGSIAFCAIHVAGFIVIRKTLYALVGAHYGGPDWLYEYRKDAVTYCGLLLVLAISDWAARLWVRSRRPAPATGPRTVYALKDGSRVLRAPMDEIVAVTSARNYVEFHLADGRKPLVRDTLAKVEQDLAGAGFLRTHRSWLVNPAHVRAISPATGGDFRLELATGLTIPLSRRFPAALERLRSPQPMDAAPG